MYLNILIEIAWLLTICFCSTGTNAVTNQPEANENGQNENSEGGPVGPVEPLIDLSGTHEWNESLLDCCDDIGSCMLRFENYNRVLFVHSN